MRTGSAVLVALLAGAATLAPSPVSATAPTAPPDLRADVDQDGLVDVTGESDEAGEEQWRPGRGAVFLPNLDDDARRCRATDADLDRVDPAVDERLAACHDAADERVNGPRDEADLAPLRVRPMRVGDDASGRIDVPPGQAPYVRIFIRRSGQLTPLHGDLTARELRTGVELAVEGRDVVRDPRRWNGEVDFVLTVRQGPSGAVTSDRVRMKVAPVLVQHDLQRAESVFAAAPGPGSGIVPGWIGARYKPTEWKPFADSLRRAAERAGLPRDKVTFTPGTAQWWRDIWRQDMVEPGTVSMPVAGGVHRMRVLLRAPVVWPENAWGPSTLSRSARLLFRDLRGPDVGVVQQFTRARPANVDDLQNFAGNFESVPPQPGHPQGRVVYGTSATRAPDPSFVRMLAAQGQQAPIAIDTSWLVVGHTDETVHVVRADNARGWTLMVSDPRQAVRLLKEASARGEGGRKLFEGTTAEDRPTVDAVLGDGKFVAGNEEAARRIDGQLATLLHETGLPERELVRVPVLYVWGKFDPSVPEARAVAFSPGLANGLSLTARDYAAPDPHGPRVGREDLFRTATERALRGQGVRVHWVENFKWAHLAGGEVHCATNALRDTSREAPWWRGGGARQ
ncbi:protein-arginine deiminase family protein [Streptomyces sp. NBC_00237]|uniref:protein-arginine deiminase family protein n=1 Tax=Streptomyces sp. NBC_00237 TaxID=2975687 RepID=UPI0022519F8E|nr:protein-arginine deiminase family protein [Streptomyces sp. NBC_00237]